MRNHVMVFMWTVVSVFLVSITLAQASGPSTQPQAATQFDPHDYSGFWMRMGPRPMNAPQLTRTGQNAMRGRRPDYLVEFPSESNDPMYSCNPQGFPRLMWEENEPFEFVQTEARILTLFQWERQLREIWTDGRELPSGENLDNIGPNWYGHSVGVWEGDTLVVRTTGFNERTWLNEYAHPLSFEAVVEERFTRIDSNTIEGRLVINDPKFYDEPWVYDEPHMFRRMRPDALEFFGWEGLFSGVTDGICAPMIVEDEYNARIQNPAIFGIDP